MVAKAASKKLEFCSGCENFFLLSSYSKYIRAYLPLYGVLFSHLVGALATTLFWIGLSLKLKD